MCGSGNSARTSDNDKGVEAFDQPGILEIRFLPFLRMDSGDAPLPLPDVATDIYSASFMVTGAIPSMEHAASWRAGDLWHRASLQDYKYDPVTRNFTASRIPSGVMAYRPA